MGNIWRDFVSVLRLVRLPNVFTAISNVWAGWVVASKTNSRFIPLIIVSFASATLYSGGIALNDYCDFSRDKNQRPNRVLPSGALRPASALIIALTLLVIGLLLGFLIAFENGLIASGIALMAFCYNTIFKKWLVSAIITMGLCRALNWQLGLNAGGASWGEFITFPIIIFLYTALLTMIAYIGKLHSLIPTNKIEKVVKVGILAMPLVDGLLVFSDGYYWQAVLIATLFIPTWLLGTFMEMT